MNKICALVSAAAVAGLAGSAFASAFSYSNFNSTAGLTLVGATTAGAGLSGEQNTLSLTQPGQFSSVGGVWKTDKQDVGLGFVTDFKFRVRDRGQVGPADGLAFVIQNASVSALGGAGGAIGFATNPFGGTSGISNSLAIVFDTYDNNGAGFVQSGTSNVVQVQSKGLLPNTPTADANLGVSGSIGSFADGAIKSGRITYTPGVGIQVFFENLASPVLTVPVTLSNQIALSGIQSWIGFTSATGGAPQRHELIDWTYNGEVPTPATAALLGIGGLVAARRRRSAR